MAPEYQTVILRADSNIHSLLLAGLFVVGLLLVIAAVRAACRFLISYRQPMVYLCLTPPSTISRPIEATEKLFAALHSFLQARSSPDRLLGRQNRLSFEIVSTKPDGVRFVVSCPEMIAGSLERLMAGFIPELKVARIADPLLAAGAGRVVRFRQQRHYAFPLQTIDALHEHDPISYLTNAMTTLQESELLAVQFIIQPVHKPAAARLMAQFRRNEDVLGALDHQRLRGFIRTLLSGLIGLLHELISPVTASKNYQPKSSPTNRTISSFERDLLTTVNDKLSKPLFQTTLRAVVLSDSKPERQQRLASVTSAVSLVSVPKYQQLVPVRFVCRRLELRSTAQRLAGIGPAIVLATHELASLYHFPTTSNTKTDNLITSLSRTLPAPVSLKNGTPLDVLLGMNDHHGVTTPIGLTAAERERHVYIVGGTGNGKTTLLLYAIIQDITAGKGLAVLDPHGDLAETILRHIPKERIGDVIYLNPDDLAHPIGINLLEMKPGLSGDELLREKDLITESVISVLRKIFSENDSGGHRIEYVLRNAIQTALTVEGATLFTIYELLNDAKFRKAVTRNLEDQDLKNFWKNELGRAGDMQRIKMVAGITAKIGRFLFSASARRVLEQSKSSIDFEAIINDGKILICNLSKGLIGEDTSTLFGTTVLAKLQIAALRRARLTQADRRPYYLYVDEFQNFATMSFVQMLSEARKYKLFLTMAEQSTAQQEQQRMVDIILANVGSVVCFRTGSPADEYRLLPLFKPYIDEGELANLPAYAFYARTAAVHAQEPMSGVTLLTPRAKADCHLQVIEASRSLSKPRPATSTTSVKVVMACRPVSKANAKLVPVDRN